MGSMAATQQKAVSSASPKLLAPGRTNTELLVKHVTARASSCRMCKGIFPGVETDSKQACGRHDQTDELLCLAAEPQEEVGRLRSIGESEGEVDPWSCTLPLLVHAHQLWRQVQDLLRARRKAVSQGPRRDGRRLQHGAVKETLPYHPRYPYRTGIRPWAW